jgi:hypothetical protein
MPAPGDTHIYRTAMVAQAWQKIKMRKEMRLQFSYSNYRQERQAAAEEQWQVKSGALDE